MAEIILPIIALVLFVEDHLLQPLRILKQKLCKFDYRF